MDRLFTIDFRIFSTDSILTIVKFGGLFKDDIKKIIELKNKISAVKINDLDYLKYLSLTKAYASLSQNKQSDLAFEAKLLTDNQFQILDSFSENKYFIENYTQLIKNSTNSMLYHFVNENLGQKLQKIYRNLLSQVKEVCDKDPIFLLDKISLLSDQADDYFTFEYLSQSIKKKTSKVFPFSQSNYKIVSNVIDNMLENSAKNQNDLSWIEFLIISKVIGSDGLSYLMDSYFTTEKISMFVDCIQKQIPKILTYDELNQDLSFKIVRNKVAMIEDVSYALKNISKIINILKLSI